MLNWQIEVEGLKELEQKLNALNDKMEKQSIRAALRAAGRVFYDAIKAKLHRTPGRAVHASTGKPRKHLMDALKVTVPTRPSFGKWTAKIGFSKATAYIANFLERGTSPHAIRPKHGKALFVPGKGFVEQIDHPGQPARPFMRPAADTQSAKAILVFRETIKSEIEKSSG